MGLSVSFFLREDLIKEKGAGDEREEKKGENIFVDGEIGSHFSRDIINTEVQISCFWG